MEQTLNVLNALEREGILGCYAIAGAMGATFYTEPVLTFDLDVIVVLPQTTGGLLTLTPLYEALRTRGYMEEGECVDIEGVPVQFFPAYNALLEEALKEARDSLYQQTPTRVLRPEHLVAVAVQTGRDGPLLSAESLGPTRPPRTVDTMDDLTPEVSRLLAAKETRRRWLATLPFPEKVRIVLQLQAMAAPLWQARGHRVHVWPVETRRPRP